MLNNLRHDVRRDEAFPIPDYQFPATDDDNSDDSRSWITVQINQLLAEVVSVEQTSLIVGGKTFANIDKDLADVQVRIKRGMVTFVVDGEYIQSSLR